MSARMRARLPWVVLVLAAVCVGMRSFYSFCWSDESFYLAIAHRFWLGGRPLVDEWNTAQVYVVLLMPFYSLHRALFGTSEGIYLAARLLHALLSSLAGIFVYLTLQKESRAGALAAGLLCIFYSRANIGGLSYYNLSLLFALFGAAALYRAVGQGQAARPAAIEEPVSKTVGTALRQRRQFKPCRGALWYLFAGGVMALTVVCCPFFAVFWVFALLPILPRFARWRQPAAWFVLGTAASAVCYLGWLLARVSPSQILEMLPVMLDDPEANPLGLRTVLMAFALPAYQFRYALPLWGGALALVFWRLVIRRQPFTAHTALLPAGLALAALAVNLLFSGRMLGKPHAALCLAALPLFFLLPNARRPWRCFFCFGLPGGVLAFCWQLASNTRFSGMTIGFALASVWAAMTAAAFARWLREAPPLAGAAPKKASLIRALPALCLLLCLACPVLAAGVQRMVLVYRDDPITLCSTKIDRGPARGLYTSAENARLYEEAWAVLAALPDDAGPLYISSLMPWGYLVNDLPCGSPNSWRVPLDHVQLPGYYTANPQNFPRTVLVLRPEYGRYRSTVEGTEGNGTNANVTESWFLDQLAARGYTKTEVACGWLYTAP